MSKDNKHGQENEQNNQVCQHVFKRGEKKNTLCGKKVFEDGLCKQHYNQLHKYDNKVDQEEEEAKATPEEEKIAYMEFRHLFTDPLIRDRKLNNKMMSILKKRHKLDTDMMQDLLDDDLAKEVFDDQTIADIDDLAWQLIIERLFVKFPIVWHRFFVQSIELNLS